MYIFKNDKIINSNKQTIVTFGTSFLFLLCSLNVYEFNKLKQIISYYFIKIIIYTIYSIYIL